MRVLVTEINSSLLPQSTNLTTTVAIINVYVFSPYFLIIHVSTTNYSYY